MGVFADAMQAAADSQQSTAVETGTASTPAPDSTPESSAASSGTAPSTPEDSPQTESQQPSPTGARTPTTPAQPGQTDSQPGKTVDLRALQEARGQNKALRDTYGWLPREHAASMREFYQAYLGDRVGTLTGELEPLLDSPQEFARIVEWFGRHGISVARRGAGNGHGHVTTGQIAPAQAADDPEPQPDFRLADGTLFMSAERQAEWRAWHARQDDRRIAEKLQPLEEFVTQSRVSQAHQQMVTKANKFAEEVWADASTWPHFAEQRAAIAAKYPEFAAKMPAQAALQRAYIAVMNEAVLPNLSKTERAATVADMQARVKATTPNPTRPTGVRSDRRPETFREAAERILGRK